MDRKIIWTSKITDEDLNAARESLIEVGLVAFRKLVHEGDYFVMLKRKESIAYDCIAVRKTTADSAIWDALNNHFYKDNTFTAGE